MLHDLCLVTSPVSADMVIHTSWGLLEIVSSSGVGFDLGDTFDDQHKNTK